MFLKFDGVGSSEDLVVLLKLVDASNPLLTTTKAIIVDHDDLFTNTMGNLPPAAYNISLDNNDAALIIESNDYNNVGTTGENWVIYGAQILTSTEGISGSGINLVRATGPGGASTSFQNFESAGAPPPVADTTDGSEPMKITDIGIVITTTTTSTLPADLNFSFKIVDADGDSSATQTLHASVAAAPVILDLNGDHHLDFLAQNDPANHVQFDFDGNGLAEHPAWAGPHEGILVHDANNDHVANYGSEISFADPQAGANTDLQGLLLHFDTSHDGKLDAADAEFAKFGVWQDSNSDGKTDAGEYHTLTEAGIVSINLTSDGISYTAAGGDVMVHGTTTFAMADGSNGIAGDVSLAVGASSASQVAATQPSAALPITDLIDMNGTVEHLLPTAAAGAKVDLQVIANSEPTHMDAPPITQASMNMDVPVVEHVESPAPSAVDNAKVVAMPENVAPVEDLHHAVA